MVLYFKSFEPSEQGLATKTRIPETNERVVCQTLESVISEKQLLPNTNSSLLPKRLCASLVHPGYRGSYRPEGLLFETEEAPAYCAPFDIMALTRGSEFTSAAYGVPFVKDARMYLFRTVEEMLKRFPSSETALRELERLRWREGLTLFDDTKMNYTECCFEKPVAITPIAVVGTSPEIATLGKAHGLLRYNSIAAYHRIQQRLAQK